MQITQCAADFMKIVHLITLLFVLGKETVGIETNDREHSSEPREPEDEDKSRDHCTLASNGKYNWTKVGHVLRDCRVLAWLVNEGTETLFFNYHGIYSSQR